MATDLENLTAARSALYAALAANAGAPNYSIDGQSVSIGELFDRIDKLNTAINVMQGPWEERIEGRC